VEETLERMNKPSRRGWIAPRELPVRREDKPGMALAASQCVSFESAEVRHVLGDDRTRFRDSDCEDLYVRRALESPVAGIVDRSDVVAARSQLLCHRR
jgi:hypothetical protein